ncbi:MAG: hypothetical protein JXL97_07410 [Bacteroidales bacterium]|nr:hypothetical protein [Bacteroidales bacterium]
MNKQIIIISVFFVSFFTSCMHKNVETCNVDDINKIIVHKHNNQNYLISYELIFQARSKSSGNGITTISGFNDTRISVYDIDSGELIARKKFGRYLEKTGEIVLGAIDDKIWLYSMKDELYAVDISTLEPAITMTKILEKNPDFNIELAKPQWYEAQNYFGYNQIEKKIIFSDNMGYKYELNPSSLKIKKTDDSKEIGSDSHNSPLSTYVSLNNTYISFNGDLRQTISINSEEINPELSFLEGKFILDNNINRIYKSFLKNADFCTKEINKINFKLDSLKSLYGDDEWEWEKDLRNYYRDLKQELDLIERENEFAEKKIDEIKEGDLFSITYLLMPEEKTDFFVFHSDNTNPDSRVRISMIEINQEQKGVEKWNILLDKLFFDYNQASENNDFKRVFSKGDPSFDFQFFDLVDNKLIVIYMLHAYCIDINNGNVLWSMQM